MENIKKEECHPSQILSLKKGNAIVSQIDCMEAGGNWEISIANLLKDGWIINEVVG